MTTKGPYATMAATGTTQATAAEMVADKVLVTTVTQGSADGVLLPPGNLDKVVVIVNGSSSASLSVYPRSGGKLNNRTADAALELPAGAAARFEGVNHLNWIVFF